VTAAIRRRDAGFSLLEVLIAMSLFTITLTAIMMTFDSNRRSYVRGEAKMNVQQGARLALGSIVSQLRMTGYFPENFDPSPPSPALDRPIQIATDTALAIHGDLDGSGGSAVYLYCLDGTTLRRGRASDGDVSAYWCPAGDVLAENVSSLRFDYFDEDNATIPASASGTFALDSQIPGAIPVYTTMTQRAAVRRVVISMTVTDTLTTQGRAQVFHLGSEVFLRNVR